MKVSAVLIATLTSTTLALPLVSRQSKTAESTAEMLKGASDFSPKFLSGDFQGVAGALGNMIEGAVSYPFSFFSDLGKGASSVSKRQAQTTSAADSLSEMIKGATEFAPKFLAGDQKGVATALQEMTGGAASFPAGFFADLAKASNGVGAGAPKSPAKE